jgi:hypothetical protein
MAKAIGFLSWKDFLREIERERPAVVRVQSYHKTRSQGLPLPEEEFFIEAAFSSGEEILFVRFPLGGAPRVDLDRDPDLRKEFHQRMAEAERILAAAMAPYGIEVRPGIFLKEDPLIETDPEGLWRWDRNSRRLVPEIPMAEAPA